MKQSTKRIASLFFSLILFGAAFVVFFAFVEPLYSDAQNIRAEQLSRQQFVDQQKAVVNQVKTLMTTYEGDHELRDLISLVIPLTPDVGTALAELNGILLQNSLAPQSFSVAAGANQLSPGAQSNAKSASSLVKPYGSVNVQVRFTGSYENFRAFLHNLETNVRLFDVKSITLQPVGKPTQDLYVFDMTVAAYYQSQ